MAISKVKLPDNSVQDIHDSRLPSVYPRIYVGTCSTAAATAAKVVTTEEFPLVNGNPVVGTTIAVKFSNTNTVASPTLNVNGTGAHSIFYSNAVYTSSSSIAGAAGRYTYYVWDGTYWVWLNNGTDNNDNTLAYNVRYNSGTRVVTDHTARYRILFSSADDSKWVPANSGTSSNATDARTVNQTKINPFGQIVYYATTTVLEANGTPAASTLYTQYAPSFGYSFNRTGAALTLTAKAPIYIKCAPQTDGSAIIDADTPYVQALPSTDDGKIYIYLGIASSATAVELSIVHPVYYYKDGQIRLWTNGASADISGKQDKWAEVGTLEGVTTLTPTSTGGAVALVDGEQAIGLGYMHFVEGQDLPDAYTLGIDSNGFKAEALDENAGALITLDGNGLAMHSTPITGLPTPTANDEAATKGYVDSAIPTSLSQLSSDSTHRTVTDAEKTAWNSKAEVFFAEYDVTTIAQIVAAYNAGKIVLLKKGGSSSLSYVEYIPLYSIYEMYEGSEYTYADFYTPLREDLYFTRYSVSSNGWSNEEWCVANEDEIFVATYGSTSFSSILSAFNSGKQIVVKDNSNNTVYHLASQLYPTVFLFFSVGEEHDILLAECTQNEGWSKSEYTIPGSLSQLSTDSTHRLVTDTEKSTWNGKYTKPSTGIPASDLASGVIPSVPVTDVTVGGTSVVSSGTAVIPAIPAAQVNSDWNASSGLAQILNKPDLSDYALATGDNSYDFAANSIRLVYEPGLGTTLNVSLTFALGRLHVSIPSGGALNTNKSVAFTDDIPTVPTISTNVVTDKASDTKTSSPKSVYDEIHPATQSSQPAGGFLPNVVYNLGTLSGNTTFALATPADSSVANHYYWTFDTGSTAPTITWPASITGWNGGSAPTINASKHYEISVLNGVGAFMEV